MVPNIMMKAETPPQSDFSSSRRNPSSNFNILKALLQITIQVSTADKSRDVGFREHLKPSAKFRGKFQSSPFAWIIDADEDDESNEDKWIRDDDPVEYIPENNSCCSGEGSRKNSSVSSLRKSSSSSTSRKSSFGSTSRKSSSDSTSRKSSFGSTSRKSSSGSTSRKTSLARHSRKNSSESDSDAAVVVLTRKSSNDAMNYKLDKIPLTKRWRRPSFKRNKSKDDDRSHSPPVQTVANISEVIDQMTLQQHLALKALNLTAPASSSALHNQRHSFVQLSGHEGYLSPAGPQTIYKKVAGAHNETLAYGDLMNDPAREIVPKFYGEVEISNEKFIEISDLLHGFVNPSVMDIKMGTRTFVESEADNLKPRNDLYFKMLKLDPSVILDMEHETKSMTKLRYMNLRDLTSSSRCLGFRLEALKMSNSLSVTQMKKLQSKEIVTTLGNFVQNRESTKIRILENLSTIRDVFERSQFFRTHEVIGSSILIVYDETHAGAWIIDFAKTINLPLGINITHRDEWLNGNHEDGYLLGLDNLIDAFEKVQTN